MVKIAKPFVTKADSAPAYWQIGNLWKVMATGVQTDNAFTLLDQVVHSGGGGGPVTHAHTQDEGLYIISGKCTFNAGGHDGLSAPAGTFVLIPGNTEHSFTVDEADTHMLNFYLPAGFEQLLIGIAHPATDHKPPNPDTVAAMMAPPWLADKLSEQYGQTSVLGNPFVVKPDPNLMYTKPTPGATLFPFTVNSSELRTYSGMGGDWKILADSSQTGGVYTLLEVRFQDGVAVPPRIYKDRDEMLYVMDGNLTVQLDDEISTAGRGSFVFIPSGCVYSIRAESGAHCLDWHVRSGFERLIKTVCNQELSAGHASKQAEESVRLRLLREIGMTELTKMQGPL